MKYGTGKYGAGLYGMVKGILLGIGITTFRFMRTVLSAKPTLTVDITTTRGTSIEVK